MVTGRVLVARYAAFAAVATTANLVTQWLVLQTWTGPWPVRLAVLAGTAVGIPIKYMLDKSYIFAFQPASFSEDSKLFVIYTGMAVLTTLVFWGTEFAFHVAFHDDSWRLDRSRTGPVDWLLSEVQA